MRLPFFLILALGLFLVSCTLDKEGLVLEKVDNCVTESITNYYLEEYAYFNKTLDREVTLKRPVFFDDTRTTCFPAYRYRINGREIDFTGWGVCSVDVVKKCLVCDSLTDGNGDGVCQGGETCFKKCLKDGKEVTEYKNSESDFTDSKPGYALYMPQEVDVK